LKNPNNRNEKFELINFFERYERTNAEYVTKLPHGKHSTKGVGRTAPDPNGSLITPEGYEIPMGKSVDTGKNTSSLLYNE
jgi:hypothetical protein